MLRASSAFFRRLSVLLLALAPAACGNGADDSASSTTEREPLVELGGHVPSWVGAARDTGALPGDQPIEHVIVLLSRSAEQERALSDLLAAQHTPGSPDYRRWLTPDEMGARFGATQVDLEAVSSWLTSRGLRVDEVARSRGSLTVSGTAAAVGAALSTELHGFDVEGEHRISVVSEPRIPASLSGVVRLFAGLSKVAPRPLHRREPAPRAAPPQFTVGAEHFLAPADFATIYNVDAAYNAGITGTGQTIAIVGRSRVDPNDITQFQLQTGQPVKPATVIIPPSGIDPGQTFDADQDEATLDVTRAGSVAPGATIDLVVSATPPASMLDGVAIAIQHTINNALAPIMSVSFGLCESVAGQALTLFVDSLFTQAAAQGMSIFVSSGDSGVAGCADHSLPPPASSIANPNYICASGSVTCVGGTQFVDTANPGLFWSNTNTPTLGSALGYIPEGAWNEALDGSGTTQLAATGGGVSGIIAKPAWQSGLGVPADGFRDTPDLSFSASGHDGYYICASYLGGDCATGSFIVFGGTSASAPSMAGIMALVDQKLGAPQGNFNPILYGLANDASASNVFHDVTIATSGVASCTSLPSLCNNSTPGPVSLSGGVAGHAVNPGFDLATGWGSLDVGNLLAAFCGSDGDPCDDGDACTQLDSCLGGACVGGNPVTCVAQDQCHAVGTCDPATGTCDNPGKADGTSCDDGNACTQLDSCKGGVCLAGSAVTCSASDACHDPGTCDAVTGACSNPAKPDGSACPGGTCEGGFCVPSGTTSSGVGGAGGGTSSGVGGAGGAGGAAASSSVGVGGAGGAAASSSVGVGGAGGAATSSSVGVGGAGGAATSSSVGVGGAISSSSVGVGGAATSSSVGVGGAVSSSSVGVGGAGSAVSSSSVGVGGAGGTGAGPGGGTSVGNGGGTGAGTGVATGAGGFTSAGAGEAGHGDPPANGAEGYEFGGCGCRVGEQSSDPTPPAGAGLVTLALALASRRRRRARRA